MYVSVTAFRVEGFWMKIMFQLHGATSFLQARFSPGLLKIETFSPVRDVNCTLSHWESKEQMLRFKSSGAHLKAMKVSPKMGRGITTGWESNEFIDRKAALDRLHAEKGSLISEHDQKDRLDAYSQRSF